MQIFVFIARAREIVGCCDGDMLFSMIFFTVLLLTAAIVLVRRIL